MIPSLGMLLLASPAQHARTPEEPLIHPQRLLVRIDPRLSGERLDPLLRTLGARELWNLPQIGWRAIEVAPGLLLPTKLVLGRDPAVQRVCYDRGRKLAYTPNDPYWPGMWHMTRIKADLAWDTEKGDPSVVVAIMDTGIEVAHPDLAANVWTNPGEIPGNGIDDDGNGYTDDVHGYDFHYLDPDPDDVHSHGTACAGIAAAVQDNLTGVTGVAPLCKVAAVKAARNDGYFFDSANVPALVYCADMGFEVISMSFFSDDVTPAEKDAIDYCWAHGVLPVAAAGNDNSVLPFYPAAYEHVLSVGATADPSDLRAYFSNWGSWVHVAAPGLSISTTYPTYYGSYTTGFGGTSGACPHVAGTAALLFSADPSATNAEVRAAIEDTALLLDEFPNGKWTSYGRIDADAALDRVLGLSSGSVPARFLFAAPCGGQPYRYAPASLSGVSRNPLPELRISGVGFEPPNAMELLAAGSPLPLMSQERRTVACRPALPTPPGGIGYELRRNGSPVGSWTWEAGPGLLYAATDGGTDGSGAQALGGFLELYRSDGVLFTCTEDSFGQIYAEFAVRGVSALARQRIDVEFRRDYDGLLGGATETLEIYDWSSFSYPYGSWVTLSSGAAPTGGFQTLTVALPGDPNAYRDDEGTFYLRLTTTSASASGLLKADLLRLRVL